MNKFPILQPLIVVILGAMFFSNLDAKSNQPNPSNAPSMQKAILYYVNAYRAQHHLPALELNATASKEATKHSQAMASHAEPFGHQHFNERIQRLYQHFQHSRGGAENVAYYKLNAKRLVEAWIASPGHRRNIEGPYNVTGIGIAHAKAGWAYYTQIFVRTV